MKLISKVIVVNFGKDLSVSDQSKSSSSSPNSGLLKLRKSIAHVTYSYIHSFQKYQSGKIGKNNPKLMTSH